MDGHWLTIFMAQGKFIKQMASASHIQAKSIAPFPGEEHQEI